MAKKLMLLPSVRSKFVKDNNMDLIYKTLLVLAGFMIIQNYLLYSFMHAIKLFLMVVVAIIVTREMEILFYSHDKDIDRATSKELIKKSYYKVTAVLYVLLIPVGTPLWLVGIGALFGTLLGKLLFGGFHHMVFHTSLVGFMLVTEGWGQLVDGANFVTAFDNFILELLFDNKFFNETLSIVTIAEPGAQSAISLFLEGKGYGIAEVALGLAPGVIGSGIVILGMFAFLVFKKAINPTLPLIIMGSFLVTSFIIGLAQGQELIFPLYHLFTGGLLYVIVFVATDPITTPIPMKGKIIFGIVVGALTMFIRNGLKFEDGTITQPIIYATLFMMMLTPMLNEVFKAKKKVVKKPVVKEAV